MQDVIIIGNGPAGISAALYVIRAGLGALVVGKDIGSLSKAGEIENYYGFEKPVAGSALAAAGVAQARRLGAEILTDEVVGLSYDGEKYLVRTKTAEHGARAVVLATGSSRAPPRIPGLSEFEGRGVSYCATCDAFFYRGKSVAVLGDGAYALSEAKELSHVVSGLALLTNGKEPQADIPPEIPVDRKKIAALAGDKVLEKVLFEDGSSLPVSGVFVAMGVAGSTDLARKLGAETDGTRIVVNADMETNLPGLFAAGGCTGGTLQIPKRSMRGAGPEPGPSASSAAAADSFCRPLSAGKNQIPRRAPQMERAAGNFSSFSFFAGESRRKTARPGKRLSGKPHDPLRSASLMLPRERSTSPSSWKYFSILVTTSRAVPRCFAMVSCVVIRVSLPAMADCSSRKMASRLSKPMKSTCSITHMTSEKRADMSWW
jgi:thioredoxin reductase (NADPH)